MKTVGYIMMLLGLLGVVFAEKPEHTYTGAGLILAGFLVYVVVRLLDRIDPDGADD